MHLACTNGALACVEVLLRAGADPSTKAQGGITPLQSSRKPGVRELIQEALDKWSSRLPSRVPSIRASGTIGGRESRHSVDSVSTAVESLAERNTDELMVPDIAPAAEGMGSLALHAEQSRASSSTEPGNEGKVELRVVAQGSDPPGSATRSLTSMDVDDPGWRAPVVIPLSGFGGGADGVAGGRVSFRGGGGLAPQGREGSRPWPRRHSSGAVLKKVFPPKQAPAKGDGIGSSKPSSLPSTESYSRRSCATAGSATSRGGSSSSSSPKEPAPASPAPGAAAASAVETPAHAFPPATPLHLAPRTAPTRPPGDTKYPSASFPAMHSPADALATPASTALLTPSTASAQQLRRLPQREGSELVRSGGEAGGRGRALFSSITISRSPSERKVAVKRRAKSLPPSWPGDEHRSRRRREGQPPRPPRPERRTCIGGPDAVIQMLTLDEFLSGFSAGAGQGPEADGGAPSEGVLDGVLREILDRNTGGQQDSSPAEETPSSDSLHMRRAHTAER